MKTADRRLLWWVLFFAALTAFMLAGCGAAAKLTGEAGRDLDQDTRQTTDEGVKTESPSIHQMEQWLQTQEHNELDPRLAGVAIAAGMGLLLLFAVWNAPPINTSVKTAIVIVAIAMVAIPPVLLLTLR